MIPKRRLLIAVLFALPLFSLAQENSPYSRYGIGNLAPQGNVLNRGMGGISAGFADPTTVNYLNPASYGKLIYTTLDVGLQVDSRTLKSTSPVGKYTSNNAAISYLQVGIPLLNGNKKATAKNIGWGMNLGLRPISKIDYKIQKFARISNIDSTGTLYEGTGGLNEAFIGTGVSIKNLSFGINAGYIFGNKNYSTRLTFLNDTVSYQSSNSAIQTSIGGLSFNAGLQYSAKIKNGVLRVGAYGNLQKSYNTTQNTLRETFLYNSSTGATVTVDSIYSNAQEGKMQLPGTYGAGFTVEKTHWLYGVDFETTNWNNYSLNGQKDLVQNNWTVKAGFQYLPASTESRKYSQFVKYRAGIYFGPDYIVANKKLSQFAVTVGAGLPLKLKRAFYETQYSLMNVALEYGNRGNTSNNLRENILHISFGFSLSDIWFRRYKYQ
jgi:hypothetical protein